MTQFHEGQEVEVCVHRTAPSVSSNPTEWRKATILGALPGKLPDGKNRHYYVQFPDGSRAVFDEAHIRPEY
jgi:hypothetical protein